jgi:hypothetical protein
MASTTGQTVFLLITIAPWGEAACATFATKGARDRRCSSLIVEWLSALHVDARREVRDLLAREQIAEALDLYNSAAEWDRYITCLDTEVRP